jgi:hypothetical protein
MQIPCVYLPGPAPAVSVANNLDPEDILCAQNTEHNSPIIMHRNSGGGMCCVIKKDNKRMTEKTGGQDIGTFNYL